MVFIPFDLSCSADFAGAYLSLKCNLDHLLAVVLEATSTIDVSFCLFAVWTVDYG